MGKVAVSRTVAAADPGLSGRARGFLSGAREIDGVLLVPTLADDDESTLIGVIDARSMACLAELRTPQIVPFGFHAAFDSL